jgi:hypothetical protein
MKRERCCLTLSYNNMRLYIHMLLGRVGPVLGAPDPSQVCLSQSQAVLTGPGSGKLLDRGRVCFLDIGVSHRPQRGGFI